MHYAIVIAQANANYSGHVPDLPGCVATGAIPDEVARELKEAVRFHIEGLIADGLPVQRPTTVAEYVKA